MCSARKTRVSSARLRCRPVVRKRGHAALWTRIVDSAPRTTTPLSKIIETAPAPLVAYQRTVSVTKGRYEPEPPETATPELEEELTVPEDGWRELVDEVLEEDEFEFVELEVVVAAVPDVEAAVPGMVSAPTVPKMPTPATAAKAMPVVRRLSKDRARSRARIRASEGFVFPMLVRMLPRSQSPL